MSKKTALISLALIIGIACAAFFILLKSADFADKAFQETMLQNGFEITNIEKIEKRIGAIRYHNLTFGSEEKTSINTLDIQYKPLLYNNIIKLSASGLFLSGELDINTNLTLKGIKNFDSIFGETKSFPDEISLKDINISLLSAHFGGIRAIANVSGQRENNAIIWTGNIDSRQNQLELIGKINAQSNNSGTWVTDIDIENAKLERNFGKFTRVNGKVQISGKGNTWNSLNAQLNAGAFITHGMSWQNANISIDASEQKSKVLIEAQSSGIKDLELNVESTLKPNQIIWTANIHAQTGKELLDYLNRHKLTPFSNDHIETISELKDLNTTIIPHKNTLIFEIKDETQNIDIKGKI